MSHQFLLQPFVNGELGTFGAAEFRAALEPYLRHVDDEQYVINVDGATATVHHSPGDPLARITDAEDGAWPVIIDAARKAGWVILSSTTDPGVFLTDNHQRQHLPESLREQQIALTPDWPSFSDSITSR